MWTTELETRSQIMPLRLPDVRRVAADVARQEDPAFQVFAATNGEGATDYTEVILKLNRPASDPSHVVIGIRRHAGEWQVRRLLRDRLRDHLRSLSITDASDFLPIRGEDVT
jgi:hypothetical protein